MTTRPDPRGALAPSLAIAAALACAGPALAADPDPSNWGAVLEEARGQTVYFNAWAGEPRINDYIASIGDEVAARYGVTLVHVKISETAETVARVAAEKAAGVADGGAVDLIWINGENFASMKANDLLMPSWAEALPNFALTAPDENPGVRFDFTVPVEGQEAPWGAAQLVFSHDAAVTPAPPKSIAALGAWAAANPGRFTYPQPPNFMGSTFLKQALLELATDADALYAPAENADFDAVTAPLWAYLDALHPNLWRSGRAFPANGPALRALFADGEIDIAFHFDPAEISAAIANGEVPETARTFVLADGTIGNVNFVAIPFNAANKAGALVVANHLLSPAAQARKQDPEVWGGLTVLSMAALSAEDRALFDAIDLGPATLTPSELGALRPEPHPSWVARLEAEWAARYGAE